MKMWKLSIIQLGLLVTFATVTLSQIPVIILFPRSQASMQEMIQKRSNAFRSNPPFNGVYPPINVETHAPNAPTNNIDLATETNFPNSQRQASSQNFNGNAPANSQQNFNHNYRQMPNDNDFQRPVNTNQQQFQNLFIPGSVQGTAPSFQNTEEAARQPQPAPVQPSQNTHLGQPSSYPLEHSNFYSKLFLKIAEQDSNLNILFSPLSLETLLALVAVGADGTTSAQLKQALELPNNREQIVQHYQRLYETQHSSPNSQLIMANKFYIDRRLGELKEDFRKIAEIAFKSDVETINFGQPNVAAANINNWVAQFTQQRIRDIITPYELQGNTEAILVNAIYFKAKWAIEFSTIDTTTREFFVKPNQPTEIQMMFNDDVFRYAEVPELDAKILELPYANSNMTMTFILPNKMDGLPDLEQRLRTINWNELWAKLKFEQVSVRIPKFRVEYKADMVQPLQQLGITHLFSNNAELPFILKSGKGMRISKIQHRAVIDVNEAGSEAAAASFAKFVPLSLPLQQKTFTANHPFIYMIRSPETVHFIGHFVRPN